MPAIKSIQILLNNCRQGSSPTINTVKLDRKLPSNLTGHQVTEVIYIMSDRAIAIFVGEGSPTIAANNLPSQKPAPTGILWLIDRT